MTISTLDSWIASARQTIFYRRGLAVSGAGGGRSSIAANIWYTLFDVGGSPGVGVLAAGDTASGVVPTDATAGFPTITFSSGTGYLSHVFFGCSIPQRLMLYDRLFHAGAYSFNANTTLTAQPSYAGRVPGNYSGLQLWYEQVTNGGGIQNIKVDYTDQAGNTGHTTGTIAVANNIPLGQMYQLPLASGDCGIQKIEKVVGTVATGGTFNILVARSLWSGRSHGTVGGGGNHGADQTGMPQVFGDCALACMTNSDSTIQGWQDVLLTIASG